MSHTCRHELLHLESRLFIITLNEMFREEDYCFQLLLSDHQQLIAILRQEQLEAFDKETRLRNLMLLRATIEATPLEVTPW